MKLVVGSSLPKNGVPWEPPTPQEDEVERNGDQQKRRDRAKDGCERDLTVLQKAPDDDNRSEDGEQAPRQRWGAGTPRGCVQTGELIDGQQENDGGRTNTDDDDDVDRRTSRVEDV